jgi:hypothetical protein
MGSLIINHFDCFVARPCGQAARGCQKVRSLPNSSGAETVFLVIAVMCRDDPNQGRAQHQFRIPTDRPV